MRDLKVYNFLEKLFGMVGKIKIHPVDFNLPWYSIYKKYWVRLGVSLMVEIINWTFFTTLPLMIIYIIKNQNLNWAIILSLVFISLSIIQQIHIKFYTQTVASIIRSVSNSAYIFFIKVDPVHHTTRESGKVISKIDRAVIAYENNTDNLVFSIIPYLVQIIVILVSFINYDFIAGIVAGSSLVFLLIISTVGQIFIAKSVIPKDNDQGDIQSQVEVESLQQVALIRSSFATPEHIQKLKKTNIRTGEVQATVWTSFTFTGFFPRIIFGISFLCVILLIFNLINNSSLDVLTAIALMTMYVSTYEIINAGRYIQWTVSNIERIKNLYTYIQEYGDSSYPV